MKASFVQQNVPKPSDDYSCPICFEDGGTFWAHQTVVIKNDNGTESRHDGSQHPIHPNCIREWVERNPICPSCRIPVKDNLVSPSRRVIQWSVQSVKNFGIASTLMEDDFYYGLFSAAMVAALAFSGYPKAHEVAIISGLTYGAGCVVGGGFGLFAQLQGKGRNEAEAEIHFENFGLPFGVLVGTLASMTGYLSYCPQHYYADWVYKSLGILFFVRASKLLPLLGGTAVGAGIAGLSGKLLEVWGKSQKEVALAMGSASAALVQHRGRHIGSTATGMFSGYQLGKVAWQSLGKYQSLWAAGAIAGLWALSSANLVERGHRSMRTMRAYLEL